MPIPRPTPAQPPSKQTLDIDTLTRALDTGAHEEEITHWAPSHKSDWSLDAILEKELAKGFWADIAYFRFIYVFMVDSLRRDGPEQCRDVAKTLQETIGLISALFMTVAVPESMPFADAEACVGTDGISMCDAQVSLASISTLLFATLVLITSGNFAFIAIYSNDEVAYMFTTNFMKLLILPFGLFVNSILLLNLAVVMRLLIQSNVYHDDVDSFSVFDYKHALAVVCFLVACLGLGFGMLFWLGESYLRIKRQRFSVEKKR